MDPSRKIPVVLSIGGSDSSAGAGVQADLKVIHACGGYALTVVTGVVAETPLEVLSWEAVSPKLLRDQLGCLFKAFPISAVKVGLLFNAELVSVVAQVLEKFPSVSVVVDPVGSASAGGEFGGETLRAALCKELFPLSSLITPNIPEAQLFLGNKEEQVTTLAPQMGAQFKVSTLVKGGHGVGREVAEDVLWTAQRGLDTYVLPWIEGADFHGTGCTLSSAIATYLSLGHEVHEAVKRGKSFLHQAMLQGHEWEEKGGIMKALNSDF